MEHYTCPSCGGPVTMVAGFHGETLWHCWACGGDGAPPEWDGVSRPMYCAVEGTPAVVHYDAKPDVRDDPLAERRISVPPPSQQPEADHAGRDARQPQTSESAAEQARAVKASTDAAARRAVEAVIARGAEQAKAARIAEPTRQQPRESPRRKAVKWLAVILIAGAALTYGAQLRSHTESDTYDLSEPTTAAPLSPAVASTPVDYPSVTVEPYPTFAILTVPASLSVPTLAMPSVSTDPKAAAKAAGATAICADGTWSFSAHRSGTCSRHGGVHWWTGNLGPAGPGGH